MYRVLKTVIQFKKIFAKSTLILVLLLLCLTSCSKGGPPPSDREVPPVQVRFEAASFSSISESFETAGELKADKEAQVSGETAGTVEAILVKEGDFAQEGDLLIKIKADDVRADLKLAESDFESYKTLEAEGAVSKQELNQKEAGYNKLLANLDNREIRAPFSGHVGQVYVDLGDYLSLGAPILDLVKNYPLRVTFTIPEKLIPYIKTGQRVQVLADSYPGNQINSVVDFISPRVDPVTRTVLVRSLISDQSAYKYLKTNQFVKVSQDIVNKSKALTVREEAIYLDQGQQFLYLAKPSDEKTEDPSLRAKRSNPQKANQDEILEEIPLYIAEKVAVETGIRQDGMVEIVEGISAGDNVVYSGLQKIYPGAKLINVSE